MVGPETPKLMVDVVVPSEEGQVLLIRRASDPYEGQWALPGGFVEVGETLEDAAVREAGEETGLEVEVVRLVGVYSDPARDPRGHNVSCAYLARAREREPSAASCTKIARARASPRGCSSPPSSSTVTTPSRERTSLTLRTRPGIRPRSPRWFRTEALSLLTLIMWTRCPASISLKGFDLSEAKVPSAAGMRSPCGSRSGCPRSFANRSVNLSETACSSLSASS